MVSWIDDDMSQWADRREAELDGEFDGVVGYPEWNQDECDAAELCAAIDAAVYTFGRLADETATLTTFARRVA